MDNSSLQKTVSENIQETVLVTGASGLLGVSMVPALINKGYKVVTHALNQSADYNADLSVKLECFHLLNSIKPSIIINLVGLTSVELCEEQPNLAYKINTSTVENIVSWILDTKSACYLIHISTDQVYDGNGPKSEEEIVLTNMYAFSKYAAEIAASKVNSTILRTNFFGKSKIERRASITDWVYSNLKRNIGIQVFDDVYFSPLAISSISNLISLVIEKKIIGVFNLGSNEGMTKADFDFIFAEQLNLSTANMTRISSSQSKVLKAYRPKDMRMDCSKFQDSFGVTLPSLRDEISQVVNDYIG